MDVDTIFNQIPADANLGCQDIFGVVKQYVQKHMYSGVKVEEINEQLVISPKSADPIAFLAVCPQIPAVEIKLENEEQPISESNYSMDDVKQEMDYEPLVALEHAVSSNSSWASSCSEEEEDEEAETEDYRPRKKKTKQKSSKNAKSFKTQFPPGVTKSFRECEICGKLVRHLVIKYAYESHLKMHTGLDFMLAGNYLKFHECKVCRKHFGSTEDLENHLANPCTRPSNVSFLPLPSKFSRSNTLVFFKGTFECGNCVNIYSTCKKLREHIYFFHLKNIECPFPECDMVVRYQFALHYHIMSAHPDFITTITSHNCDHCYAEFRTYDLVKKHKDNCPSKNIECNNCPRRFANKLSMNNHKCIALNMRFRKKRRDAFDDDESSMDQLESNDSKMIKVEDFLETNNSSNSFSVSEDSQCKKSHVKREKKGSKLF